MCQPNEIPFFFRPFGGWFVFIPLRPGASPLAIPFLPFGHNNLARLCSTQPYKDIAGSRLQRESEFSYSCR